jgi:hypothetical protein
MPQAVLVTKKPQEGLSSVSFTVGGWVKGFFPDEIPEIWADGLRL